MRGIVKWSNTQKLYGFITITDMSDDEKLKSNLNIGDEVFVHKQGLLGLDELTENMTVSFDTEKQWNAEKERATNVIAIEEANNAKAIENIMREISEPSSKSSSDPKEITTTPITKLSNADIIKIMIAAFIGSAAAILITQFLHIF